MNPPAPMSATEAIARQVGHVHHGLTILELGEDGGTLVVLGHHTDRRTVAALNRYARTVWGDPLGWGIDVPTAEEVRRVKAIVVHACDRGWGVEGEVAPASTLERIDPDDNRCEACARANGNWALLYRDDVQDQPDAFPVTVWECGA